jgi:hypothetical protein
VNALVVAFIVAVTLQFALASPASAYTFTGCRWPGTYITYINQGAGAYWDTTRLAAGEWSARTDVVLASSSSSWYAIFQRNDGPNGYDGYSTWWCNSGSTYRANSWYNTYYMSTASTGVRRTLIAHEIGHALGLNHSSWGTLMYTCPRCVHNSFGFVGPQTDDLRGMNARY